MMGVEASSGLSAAPAFCTTDHRLSISRLRHFVRFFCDPAIPASRVVLFFHPRILLTCSWRPCRSWTMIEMHRRSERERNWLHAIRMATTSATGGESKHIGFLRMLQYQMTFAWLLVGLTLLAAAPASAQQDGGSVLDLESKVPLGAVNGRIAHLAFDLSRKQVFIAELQNNSVG